MRGLVLSSAFILEFLVGNVKRLRCTPLVVVVPRLGGACTLNHSKISGYPVWLARFTTKALPPALIKPQKLRVRDMKTPVAAGRFRGMRIIPSLVLMAFEKTVSVSISAIGDPLIK